MALVHESVRDTHGPFRQPNLLPNDRLGYWLAQLSHPVQNLLDLPAAIGSSPRPSMSIKQLGQSGCGVRSYSCTNAFSYR